MYFDIGANIGDWTIANLNTADKIISVEADPETFKDLEKNTSFSNKIIRINYAVCDSNEDTIVFYRSQCRPESTINPEWFSNTRSRFYTENKNKHEKLICKTISIDKIIEIYGIPSLIKIDVEGAELQVIRSLTKKVECLCFEWTSEFTDVMLMCIDYLNKLGFTTFYLQYGDQYNFRPNDSDYIDLQNMCNIINSINIYSRSYGMLWCK